MTGNAQASCGRVCASQSRAETAATVYGRMIPKLCESCFLCCRLCSRLGSLGLLLCPLFCLFSSLACLSLSLLTNVPRQKRSKTMRERVCILHLCRIWWGGDVTDCDALAERQASDEKMDDETHTTFPLVPRGKKSPRISFLMQNGYLASHLDLCLLFLALLLPAHIGRHLPRSHASAKVFEVERGYGSHLVGCCTQEQNSSRAAILMQHRCKMRPPSFVWPPVIATASLYKTL